MNKAMAISLVATGMLLCSAAQAGNNPNSTRILTSGIGSGTTTARVPGSLPYNSHAAKRNSKADVSLTNYRSGYSRRPDSSTSITSSSASSSRPTSIPASLPAQAIGHAPESIGGKPAGVGSNAPSSIPASLPSQATGHVPATIGSSASSGIVVSTPPTSIPATIPSQAAGHVPATIGASAGIGGNAPTSIPATIPSQAAGHVPTSIGGRP